MQSIKLRFKSIKFLFLTIIVVSFFSLLYLRRPPNAGDLNVTGPSVVYSIIIDVTIQNNTFTWIKIQKFNFIRQVVLDHVFMYSG
jgi:hypothetical protein